METAQYLVPQNSMLVLPDTKQNCPSDRSLQAPLWANVAAVGALCTHHALLTNDWLSCSLSCKCDRSYCSDELYGQCTSATTLPYSLLAVVLLPSRCTVRTLDTLRQTGRAIDERVCLHPAVAVQVLSRGRSVVQPSRVEVHTGVMLSCSEVKDNLASVPS